MTDDQTRRRPARAAEPARIIIADGDPLARQAIRRGFDEADDFVVVAEAHDGVETAELAAHYHPEVVLLEMSLPRVDGLTATERILAEAPATLVIMLAATHNARAGLAALRIGSAGVLAKDIGVDAVVQAVRSALTGEIATSPEMNRRLVEHLRSTPEFGVGLRPIKSALSSREWEVLDLLTLGRSTVEIADRLRVAPDTIQSHVKNIMRKLEVHTRAEAVERGNELRRLSGEMLALEP